MRGLFEWLLVIAAPVIQQKLSTLRVNGKIKLPIGWTTAICACLGFILPILATIMFLQDIDKMGIMCGNGAVGMAIIGFMVTIIFTPIIAKRSLRKYREKNQLAKV